MFLILNPLSFADALVTLNPLYTVSKNRYDTLVLYERLFVKKFLCTFLQQYGRLQRALTDRQSLFLQYQILCRGLEMS